MASSTNPPLVTAQAPGAGTGAGSSSSGLARTGTTSTITVDATQTALDVDLPTNTAGLVLLLQPTQAPLLANGCAQCGPPISCLMCPDSFQCLMGVQTDCSTCPQVKCVAFSTSPSQSEPEPEAPPNLASGEIIGGVLGGVGGMLLLALAVFYFLWKKKHKSQMNSRSTSRAKKDSKGIIIDDNYIHQRQDPLGSVRESHAKLHEDPRNSITSLSTLFEDASSVNSPKSPVIIYTRPERKTDRVRTPVMNQQFENPDLPPPSPSRGLSSIFQLPKPLSSRLSLGSLFSDTGRLSLSFKSSKHDLPLSNPSSARHSSLTMSSNDSNIIPIAYMPGVVDSSSIADQYSAYQERKAARKRENEEEAKHNSEHVENVSETSENDPYMSAVSSDYYHSDHYLYHSKHNTTRFGPPVSSLSDDPVLQPLPLNSTRRHIRNSTSLSTLFHDAPNTPPLNVSGKRVTSNQTSHSRQSSISSVAILSTDSFDRLWAQTGALVADENHIPPSPPNHDSDSTERFASAPTSPDEDTHSRTSTTTSTPSMAQSADTDPNDRYSTLTTASYLSGESVPYLTQMSARQNTSRTSVSSIQPSVIISRASTTTRNRIDSRPLDAALPPRSSSLKRSDKSHPAP
ncbi:hypothetical protein CJU90_3575 [Yarrowia sp. C11]|nr:hypothetical protein CJU90_3575 [Yarrowia sp. C11]